MVAYLLTSSCPTNPGVGCLVPTNVALLGKTADSITRVKIDKKRYLTNAKIQLDGACETCCTKHVVLAYVKYYCSGQPRRLSLCLIICTINVVSFNPYMHPLQPGVHLNNTKFQFLPHI
jgi:hypothetical protein